MTEDQMRAHIAALEARVAQLEQWAAAVSGTMDLELQRINERLGKMPVAQAG